jgi:hypothetical protein
VRPHGTIASAAAANFLTAGADHELVAGLSPDEQAALESWELPLSGTRRHDAPHHRGRWHRRTGHRRRRPWGPHVLYADGPLWRWLDERGLARPAARLAAVAGVVTFDHDPGRLAATFVAERLRRATSVPSAARYAPGGWATLIDRLAGHARRCGVRIETASTTGSPSRRWCSPFRWREPPRSLAMRP